MKSYNNSPQDLLILAGDLASAVESLAARFEQEDIRLKRSDRVAVLQALNTSIMADIEKVKNEEKTAGYDHSGKKSNRQLAQAITGMLGDISDADWLKSLSQNPCQAAPWCGTDIRHGPCRHRY